MQQAAARLATAPRRITVLGSTGSVGCNTIDLIEREPRRLRGRGADRPTATSSCWPNRRASCGRGCAVVGDAGTYAELKEALAGSGIEVAAGADRPWSRPAARPAEWVMAAIVGAAGLEADIGGGRAAAPWWRSPTRRRLVCAGALMMAEIARSGATLLPVDSEHSAIFQVFDFEQRRRASRRSS